MSNTLTEFTACECGHEVSIPPYTHGTKCYKCEAWVESNVVATTPEEPGSAHYRSLPVEPIEVTKHMGFLDGNVVKYVMRFRTKGGKEDLLKALQYLEWLIEEEYPEDE